MYQDRYRSRLGNKSRWRTLSTARKKSSPKLKGTRAWIVVQCWGRDSMENVPFSISSRSAMLMRAKPPACRCGFSIKTQARMADRELNLTGRSPQSHFEVANATTHWIARIILGRESHLRLGPSLQGFSLFRGFSGLPGPLSIPLRSSSW